jgi:uncharacterized protein (DUF1501 family)
LSARRIGRLMREQFNLGFVDVGGWDTHFIGAGRTAILPTDSANSAVRLQASLRRSDRRDGEIRWSSSYPSLAALFVRTATTVPTTAGSVYWVMGGGINGGRILGDQIKVEQARRFQNRDYPILTDYRSMFAGLFQRMYGLEAASVQRIFAGIHPAELGLVWSRSC